MFIHFCASVAVSLSILSLLACSSHYTDFSYICCESKKRDFLDLGVDSATMWPFEAYNMVATNSDFDLHIQPLQKHF